MAANNIHNLRAVRIAGTIVHLLPVKHFYCIALRVSQGPWTDLPQRNRARVWRAVLVLRESEGTVQNTPFQTCASEEGCRNQVTGSPVRHTACHSCSTYATSLSLRVLRKLHRFLLVHLLFYGSFQDGHIHFTQSL